MSTAKSSTATTAEEAIPLIQKAQPSLVIVDLQLPGISGIGLIRHMRRHWPQIKVLVFSGYSDDHYLQDAAALQVEGYILKTSPPDEILAAVRAVLRGERAYDPAIVMRLTRIRAAPPAEVLTAREMEVLRLLAQGLPNKEIAKRLMLSKRTVDFYVRNIMDKLEADNRVKVLNMAREKGIIG